MGFACYALQMGVRTWDMEGQRVRAPWRKQKLSTGDAAWFAREMLGFLPDPLQEELLRCEGKQTILNCSRQWGEVDCGGD